MYLGVDLGTSSVKSLLIDEQQNIIAEASKDISIQRLQQGYSEQNPEEWWHATLYTIDSLAKDYANEVSQIKAIGLSGQMHGLTLLDKSNHVLRNAILWNDGRAFTECLELKSMNKNFVTISGNDVMAGFSAPKLLWLRKHEPEIFANIAMILLPKDYLRFCLCGDFVSEMSDASGTSWLDVANRDWSDELLATSSINRNNLPKLIEGNEASGTLSKELCNRWNIKQDVVIAGGAGDNAAAACGIGAIGAGDGFISLGTSGVIFISNDNLSTDPNNGVHAFCHAIENKWHQMAVILSATDSLNWFSNFVNRPIDKFINNLGSIEDGSAKQIFLPYLSGERTPHNNSNATASLIGLSHSHSIEESARAVLEGVAFAIKDCVDVLANNSVLPEEFFVVGGGTKSKLWLQIIATLINKKLLLTNAAHLGAAFGAARLAMAACKEKPLLDIFSKPNVNEVIEPCHSVREDYLSQFDYFKKLYYSTNKEV